MASVVKRPNEVSLTEQSNGIFQRHQQNVEILSKWRLFIPDIVSTTQRTVSRRHLHKNLSMTLQYGQIYIKTFNTTA
jgi:hypothetical protein